MHSWRVFQTPSAVSVPVWLQFGEALGTDECWVCSCAEQGSCFPLRVKQGTGEHFNCRYMCTKERCKTEDIYLKRSWKYWSQDVFELGVKENTPFSSQDMFICQVQPGFSSWGFNGWKLIQNGNIDRLRNNNLILFIPCPYMHFFPEGSSDFSLLQ